MLEALKGNLRTNKLVLIIMAAIAAVILLVILAVYLVNSSSNSNQTSSSTVNNTSVNANAPVTSEVVISETTATDLATPEAPEQTDNFAALVDESLLEQPTNTDPALAKDELVQLNDIQTQLNEQKEMIEQQHADADKLIKLKEQQLLALEKQLATP